MFGSDWLSNMPLELRGVRDGEGWSEASYSLEESHLK